MLRTLKFNLWLPNAVMRTRISFMASQDKQKESNNDTGKGSQPKIVKLNRKRPTEAKLQPLQPEYAGRQDHLSKTETAYYKNIQNKIAENLATRKFYDYEMSRGEDLIEDVPVDPYYEYKLEDVKLETQARQKMIDNLKGIKAFVDPHRYEKLKNLVTSYQTMKHRYEAEQFFKKLKQYPGSVRGPNPEDDPVVYNQYVASILPEWVLAQMKLSSTQKMRSIHTEDDQNTPEMNLGENFVSNKLSNEPRLSLEQDGDPEQATNQISGTMGPDTYYDPVPPLPQTMFDEYHSYMAKLKMWGKFRKYYVDVNLHKNIKKFEQTMLGVIQANAQKQLTENQEGQKKRIAQGEEKKASEDAKPKKIFKKKGKKGQKKQSYPPLTAKIEPRAYSLYTYYKTLPKEIQEHPGVRAAYIGLEYSSPDASYEQKQQILNEAAKLSLPLDKFSIATMDKLCDKMRVRLTPHLTDRIYNMNPEFTWDIHEFLTEVKDQKLRSISTVKEKEQSYIEPPEKWKESDESLANLPVDFYDNDDGFWTQYIDQKLQRYQKVQPLSTKPKKHFIH